MSGARFERDGTVAIVTLDAPPVNGLGHALRRGIVAGLEAARADEAVQAVVLIGAGRCFSAGADLRELGTPAAAAEPTLATVIRAVEASPKPVVAALHGATLGGGLELALACHHRVAAPDAQVGLPEVRLGMLPGAGGTQRLPRAIGLEGALDLVLTGRSARAADHLGTALVDELVEGDLRAGAVAFAAGLGAGARPPCLLRDLRVASPDAAAALAAARERAEREGRGLPAPRACVEALTAAVARPFEEGLRVERELFLRLVRSPEARALRHAFLAERAAARVPGLREDAPVRAVRAAAVVGAGTMGAGIATCFANAGLPVTLLDENPEALERGLAAIRRTWREAVAKGRLGAAEAEAREALVRPASAVDAIGEADVVVEAVFEDLGVKEAVFRALDRAARPGAVLATNTSTLDVDRIAAFTRRPADVIGLHFFSPAHLMRLLEVVRGARTGDDVLATALALGRRLGKAAVVSGVCDGFIGNRMLERYRRQAFALLEEGALPRQVDRALERWGFAMGPFRVADVVGNDVSWLIRKRRYAERPEAPRQPIADRLCELGRFGQKTGAGWYRYEPGRREAVPDPEVEALVAEVRRELGIAPREISEREVVERCVLALGNEGARILEEGIALRASDVDLVWLAGYGFPAHRGGPMYHLEELGLAEAVKALERYDRSARGDPGAFAPAALLVRRAAEGRPLDTPS